MHYCISQELHTRSSICTHTYRHQSTDVPGPLSIHFNTYRHQPTDVLGPYLYIYIVPSAKRCVRSSVCTYIHSGISQERYQVICNLSAQRWHMSFIHIQESAKRLVSLVYVHVHLATGKGFTPPEVRRGKYWGLGVILLQYFPLVKI